MSFDLDGFFALPRVAGLALSADGARLVTTVATPSRDGTKFVSALWELDPVGAAAPRRLTRSRAGESAPAFRPDGSLVFLSARPEVEPAAGAGDDQGDEGGSDIGDDGGVAALWVLPPAGEAHRLHVRPAAVEAFAVARDSGDIAFRAAAFPAATSPAADRERAQARSKAGVKALLFEQYPVRFWDHDLGPREPRLYLLPAGETAEPTDLVPVPGRALDEAEFDVAPDGSFVVTTWAVPEGRGHRRLDLVVIDTRSGERRTLAGATGFDHGSPSISPDGRDVVCTRLTAGTPAAAPDVTLWLVDVATGAGRDLTPTLDRWPQGPRWAPDGAVVLFVADEAGRGPLFCVGRDGGPVRRLSMEGTFSDLCPAPDGASVYALRSSYLTPPGAVAVAADRSDGVPRSVPTPGLPLQLPGSVVEVHAAAGDGTPVRSWLVLPAGASAQAPAPLLLWVHGGPLASWNAWHWRWCPHVFAARGYALLLPDPALSTGYGRDFIARGYGRWGDRPYTDVMAAVDAALERPDLDDARTAVMGGSFGGYLANWIAGHTDRFRAVVTHASLWALDQFHGTTDAGVWWEREFGSPYDDPSRYVENSPHRHVAAIRTPMLVIHGERDARVPISEALRLWTDLSRHGVEAKYLFFPDENHWILKPGNARVWYETVLAFLDHHVLGTEWARPRLL